MAYYCSDCSYRGTTSGQGGECPACGSFRITKPRVTREKPQPKRSHLVMLVLLWAYLIAHITWKLNS